MRIGHGYDVHRITDGRKLILCGITIPWEKGLLGHSDADVAVHALMDALLGACALGDIGHWFPDSDPAYAGADSMGLLRIVAEKVTLSGYRLSNGDITILLSVQSWHRTSPKCGKDWPKRWVRSSGKSASRPQRRKDSGSPVRERGSPPMP